MPKGALLAKNPLSRVMSVLMDEPWNSRPQAMSGTQKEAALSVQCPAANIMQLITPFILIPLK